MVRKIVSVIALGGLLTLAACGDDGTDPVDGVEQSQLDFLRFPPDLVPLATQDTSFWAVAGEDREVILHYRPEAGEQEGEEFLRFKVPGDALLRRPDGSFFARGDSVEIRVQVDPDGRFLFGFQPSGLRFDPEHPAELRVEYVRLGGDLDGDGDVDEADDDFERELRLWKQEAPGGLWFPVGSVKIEDLDEIEAEITSFTGFAIAV